MQQYSVGDFGHSSTYRGQFSNASSVCRNGCLMDSDYSALTTAFHRRSKQYNNHFSLKNQQNTINNNAMVILVTITIYDVPIGDLKGIL